MNRQISIPAGAVILVIVLAGAILATRALGIGGSAAAAASPHRPVMGIEPSAQNVSQELTNRLHSLTRKVEADPADTSALLELARLLHDAHRPQEAAVHYERYLELEPQSREVWFDLADARGSAGNWRAARDAMETLRQRDPEDGAVLYNLGVIEAQSGNMQEARGWWEKAAAQTASPEMADKAREALASLESKR